MPVTPKAKYEIVADDKSADGWRSALDTANRSGEKLGSIMEAAFAGVTVAAIGEAIGKAIEFGDEIGKAAQKAGLGAKQMSELAYAAHQSDVDLGPLSEALKKMQVNLAEAADGSKETRKALADIGLTIDQLKGLQPDQQFEQIAEAISQVKDPADRTRAAVELFGKAGSELLPLFAQGADGIRQAREEAERLGVTLDEKSVKKLQEADDAIKQLKASFSGFATTLTAEVAPAITAVLRGFTALATGDWNISLQKQLGNLAAERNRLLKVLANEQEEGLLNRLLFGSEVERQKAIKETENNIAAVEKQMNDLNEKMLAADRAAQKREEGAAGSSSIGAKAPRPFFNAQTKYELEQSYQYVEVLEKELEDRHKSVEEHREALSQKTEEGIREASQQTHEANMQSLDEYMKAFEKSQETQLKMSVYAEEAARNMQDAFAEFLFDPFKHGLKGMLSDFIDVIRRMVAEAAAAKLFETLFGKKDSTTGASGSGGWLSSGLNLLFGGGKADGGPLDQGKWYIAGEHGPEPIWGGGPGAFAAGYPSGGGTAPVINNYVTISGANTVTHSELARALKQSNDQVVATMRNDKRRGSGAFAR